MSDALYRVPLRSTSIILDPQRRLYTGQAPHGRPKAAGRGPFASLDDETEGRGAAALVLSPPPPKWKAIDVSEVLSTMQKELGLDPVEQFDATHAVWAQHVLRLEEFILGDPPARPRLTGQHAVEQVLVPLMPRREEDQTADDTLTKGSDSSSIVAFLISFVVVQAVYGCYFTSLLAAAPL